jgi:hypothetical protein
MVEWKSGSKRVWPDTAGWGEAERIAVGPRKGHDGAGGAVFAGRRAPRRAAAVAYRFGRVSVIPTPIVSAPQIAVSVVIPGAAGS